MDTVQVRDGQGGGYDDFPGSRREEEQRNSYSAFDYSESSEGEVEAGRGFGGSFDLASVRRQFIRKVYLLVAGGLLITSLIAAIFMFGLRDTVRANRKGWFIFAMLLNIPILAIVLAMACCNVKVGRRYPLNVILLGVLAALYGVIIGIISVFYTTESVLLAAGITCITVFVVTAFAFWTNIDFTKCIGFICVLGILLSVFGLVFVIVAWSGLVTDGYTLYALKMVYGGLGAFVMVLFLLVDTQMMMLGTHKYSYNPEDWAFAALSIYSDIINLFLYILMLVGVSDNG